MKNVFPDLLSRTKAIQALNTYRDEKPEAPRVRLAVLKLSGNDLAEIQRNIKGALEDY